MAFRVAVRHNERGYRTTGLPKILFNVVSFEIDDRQFVKGEEKGREFLKCSDSGYGIILGLLEAGKELCQNPEWTFACLADPYELHFRHQETELEIWETLKGEDRPEAMSRAKLPFKEFLTTLLATAEEQAELVRIVSSNPLIRQSGDPALERALSDLKEAIGTT